MTTKEAIEHISKELKDDEGYWISWQANIAMAFIDEWQRLVDIGGLPSTREHVHLIANRAADNFLKILTSAPVEK